ncbi:hypothetical protein [Streptomyces sp. NPDC002580]|uniref:hypothetical protein n=1 Tax=Streptomyces sp. NPDC002580 TaxID=3364653 RepID=UPI00367C1D2B
MGNAGPVTLMQQRGQEIHGGVAAVLFGLTVIALIPPVERDVSVVEPEDETTTARVQP